MRPLPNTIVIAVVGVTFAPGYPDHFVAIEKAMMFDRTPTVALYRDPDNAVDTNAIQVWVADPTDDKRSIMVGHVPAALAERMAPEMDWDGVEWEGKVAELRWGKTMDHPGMSVSVSRVPPG